MKITILLNGEETSLDENTTIEQLLHKLALTNKRLAVEINQDIIPRGAFSSHPLNQDDKVEIVQAIGGGSV